MTDDCSKIMYIVYSFYLDFIFNDMLAKEHKRDSS